MDLSGLGSVYGGYQSAQTTDIENQKNQAAAQEAAFKLLGAQVLGRALAGNQPMAPPPGQPSQPAPAAIPREMNGIPMPQPRPQGAPGGPAVAPPTPAAATPTGMPELSLESLTQRILQTTPQVRNNPQVLLAALERAAPILDRKSKEDLLELRTEIQKMGIQQRAQTAEANRIAQNERAATAEEGRNTRANERNERTDKREARLAAAAQVRQDQAWQRLETQKADLQRKIEAGDRGAAVTQMRAIIDAQHKRAGEILAANSANNMMTPADRKALLDEQQKLYDEQITALRNLAGRTTAPSTGTAPPGAPAQPKVPDRVAPNAPIVAQPSGPVKVSTPAEAMALAPGTKYVTPDGKEYTR